jgi:spermidine synthase
MIPLFFSVFVLGFTATASQIVLLRELMVAYEGNELTLGIVLALWLALSALGAWISGRLREGRPLRSYAILNLALGPTLLLSLALTRFIKPLFSVHVGEMMGLTGTFLSSALVLLPICVLFGAQFPLACRMVQRAGGREAIGRVYVLEALASAVAGALLTYVLLTRMSPTALILTAGGLNLLSGLLLGSREKTRWIQAGILVLLAAELILLFPLRGGIERSLREVLWRGQKVLAEVDSPYGRLALVEHHDQYALFVNGGLLLTAPSTDVLGAEERAHLPLLAHPAPDSVLVIGGGVDGLLEEILKHPVAHIDYLELDPAVLSLVESDLPEHLWGELTDPRLSVRAVDGVRFLLGSDRSYEVILMNLPDPSTLLLNRYYTTEFFREVERDLSSGGLFVLSLPGSDSYMSRELSRLNACVHRTLENAFEDVFALPGPENLYIAGLRELDPEAMLDRMDRRGVTTKLIGPAYFEYKLDSFRIEAFRDALERAGPVDLNRDFSPRATFFDLLHWNSVFHPHTRALTGRISGLTLPPLLALVALAALVLAVLRRSRPVRGSALPLALFTTGFSGMAFDIVLILSFQILYGHAYRMLGLVIAAFHVGLSAGALLSYRALGRQARHGLFAVELGLLSFTLLLPALLLLGISALGSLEGMAVAQVFIPLLSALAGGLVGAEFPLAAALYGRSGEDAGGTAGRLYSSDLLGGVLGALLVAPLLLPLLGLWNTFLFLLALKVLSLLVLLRTGTLHPGTGHGHEAHGDHRPL